MTDWQATQQQKKMRLLFIALCTGPPWSNQYHEWYKTYESLREMNQC